MQGILRDSLRRRTALDLVEITLPTDEGTEEVREINAEESLTRSTRPT